MKSNSDPASDSSLAAARRSTHISAADGPARDKHNSISFSRSGRPLVSWPDSIVSQFLIGRTPACEVATRGWNATVRVRPLQLSRDAVLTSRPVCGRRSPISEPRDDRSQLEGVQHGAQNENGKRKGKNVIARVHLPRVVDRFITSTCAAAGPASSWPNSVRFLLVRLSWPNSLISGGDEKRKEANEFSNGSGVSYNWI